tara:strand:+ start:140 stop:280 length:141 start_codon:yes stop_codon:yes gene_type:complete
MKDFSCSFTLTGPHHTLSTLDGVRVRVRVRVEVRSRLRVRVRAPPL